MSWAVQVTGLPAPKGSTKCIGARGPRKHTIVEDTTGPGYKEWLKRVRSAGEALNLTQPLTGPVAVDLAFTLPCPPSIRPANRIWPAVQHTGDLDKLTRLVLDALTKIVFVDDAQVVELTARKAYPHTAAADVLPQPGAIIRIRQVTTGGGLL